MIYLPKCLAPACKLAEDRGERYAMHCVRLLATDAGPKVGPYFRLEVTDGRMLVILRGPSMPGKQDELAAQRLPPNARPAVEALVPAVDLAKELAAAPKGGHLGVSLGEEEIHLSTWSGMKVLQPGNGRFPPVDTVLPEGAPIARAFINPRMLAELLLAAAALHEKGSERVELLFYRKDAPLGVITRGENGLVFDGIIMPLN